MDTLIFYLQFALSLLVYGLLTKWYLVPRLNVMERHAALMILIVPHAFRHLGLFALVQAEYNPEIPGEWARGVAIGDMATWVLAVLSMILLRRKSAAALTAVWACNIVGLIDFAYSTWISESTGLPVHLLYASWFLPTFFLPVVALSHLYLFRYLVMPETSNRR